MNKCLERFHDRHFWNPGVFSYAMIPRCRLNSTVIFIVASIPSAPFMFEKNKINLDLRINLKNNIRDQRSQDEKLVQI
jgi:hypothetical protein